MISGNKAIHSFIFLSYQFQKNDIRTEEEADHRGSSCHKVAEPATPFCSSFTTSLLECWTQKEQKKKDALVGMKTLVMVCHCVLNEAKGIPDDNEVFKAVIHEKLEVKMKRKTRL